MNKNTNLVLLLVSFGSLLLLLLTKLEYVLLYSQDYQVNSSPFDVPGKGFGDQSNIITFPAKADAQIFGFLMVVLAIGSVYFLVKTIKK